MDGFPSRCRNFHDRLHGEPGSLAELQHKMESVWMANGAEAGQLIVLDKHTVFNLPAGQTCSTTP